HGGGPSGVTGPLALPSPSIDGRAPCTGRVTRRGPEGGFGGAQPTLTLSSLRHDERALLFAAAFVGGEVAVETESTGLVGAEAEGDRLAGLGSPHDPVRGLFDREAVGNVVAGERDVNEVVLHHVDLGRVAA